MTWVVVNAATGKRGLFLLYGNHLDEQRATVDGHAALVPVAHLPTFSPSYVPTKLVQLFVEPCYYSTCLISDYAGGARPLPPDLIPSGVDVAGNERLWRLPLAVQLPSLVLLPLSSSHSRRCSSGRLGTGAWPAAPRASSRVSSR